MSIELGKAIQADKRAVNPGTTFGTRDTIYASVKTVGSSPSATLKGRWTFKGESGEVPVDEREQTLTAQGTEHTLFQISKPDGLPAGNYRFEVFSNGQSVSQTGFTVASAGSPTGPNN